MESCLFCVWMTQIRNYAEKTDGFFIMGRNGEDYESDFTRKIISH